MVSLTDLESRHPGALFETVRSGSVCPVHLESGNYRPPQKPCRNPTNPKFFTPNQKFYPIQKNSKNMYLKLKLI